VFCGEAAGVCVWSDNCPVDVEDGAGEGDGVSEGEGEVVVWILVLKVVGYALAVVAAVGFRIKGPVALMLGEDVPVATGTVLGSDIMTPAFAQMPSKTLVVAGRTSGHVLSLLAGCERTCEIDWVTSP